MTFSSGVTMIAAAPSYQVGLARTYTEFTGSEVIYLTKVHTRTHSRTRTHTRTHAQADNTLHTHTWTT